MLPHISNLPDGYFRDVKLQDSVNNNMSTHLILTALPATCNYYDTDFLEEKKFGNEFFWRLKKEDIVNI